MMNSSLGSVSLRFYAELNDLLPVHLRQREFAVELSDRRSVKDLIESFQVPHTEVDLILINGTSAGFDAILQDGDRISVYPMFEGLNISHAQLLRPEPLRHPAFICDVHLGSLARKLRLLGINTWYDKNLLDEEIVNIQAERHRAILTCDRGLLQRKAVHWGYLVRSRQTDQQVVEVIQRFDLQSILKPFTLCTECNHLLVKANQSQIERLAPLKAREQYTQFTLCPKCTKIYWLGSHITGIQSWLEKIKIAM